MALFGWVLLAMVGMRTFGMAANRLIDERIDALNLRTSQRALPAGRIHRSSVIFYTVIALIVYIVAVFNLHPVTWALSAIPVILMLVYPYLKRFTWFAHFGIGLVYLIVPPAVSLAFTGTMPFGFVILGIAGMLWVSGFDILYALLDYNSDKRLGLYSIPVRFGVSTAIWWARVLHFSAASLLFAAGIFFNFGPLYYVGAGAVALLLFYENALVTPNDLSRLNVAFFTVNGFISVLFCLFVCADILVFRAV